MQHHCGLLLFFQLSFSFLLHRARVSSSGTSRDRFQSNNVLSTRTSVRFNICSCLCTLTCMSVHYCSVLRAELSLPGLRRLILQLLSGAQEHNGVKSTSHKFWQPERRSCQTKTVFGGKQKMSRMLLHCVLLSVWPCAATFIYHSFLVHILYLLLNGMLCTRQLQKEVGYREQKTGRQMHPPCQETKTFNK